MNPQNGQTSLDYLNQIAPQAPKKPMFTLNLRTVIIGAILAIIVIVVIASIGGGLSGAKTKPWERLSARLTATTVLVDGSSDLIKNSQLRSYNSDLKLYITNTQRDLEKPLTSLGINSAKIDKSIVALESSDEMAARLEDGRLNAKYDSTYAREMSYQLATVLALLQQLYGSNVSPETKLLLEGWYNNLLPTYTAISEFSASNE